ncbi:MAG: hypothetical protein KDA28_07460, partial [Phycisphaerales bacterium]|nr:hypothetical protein [Phycisphaerales bacterium]
GHVTGAAWLDVASVLADQPGPWSLRAREDLEALVEGTGQRLVLYANTPPEAVLPYLALRRLGRDVTIVEVPWSALAARRDIPLTATLWSGIDDDG